MSRLERARWFNLAGLLLAAVAVMLAVAPESYAAGGADASEFGIIAGKVTDRLGAPQSGVPVNILSPGGRVVARATTQTTGRFSIPQLRPGIYSAEVVSPSFLPYLKPAISVKAGGLALLDVSLYKLAESVELNFPGNVEQATEDWKWVLRAQHPTRPVLRFQPPQDQPLWASAGTAGHRGQEPHENALHGTLRLTAGDETSGFGQDSGVQTTFDMSYQLGLNQSVGLTGSAGLRQGTPATSLFASYDRSEGDLSRSHLTATVRQLFLPREYWVNQFGPDTGSDNRVQSVTVGYAQERKLSENLSAEYGTLLDFLSLSRKTRRMSPYGRVNYSLPSLGLISVSYVGVGPRSMPSDWDAQKRGKEQWLAIPQISAGIDGNPVLETGRHAEARWEQAWTNPLLNGPLKTEVAVFFDELNAPALTVSYRNLQADGAVPANSLRDPYSDRYFVSGTNYRSPGVRVAASAALNKAMTLIAAYSYSGALVASGELPDVETAAELRDAVKLKMDQSIALKLDTVAPLSKTRVIASYRWLPAGAVTLMDPYNRGVGQSDPYLSVYILQPLPSPDILPGQFAAVADFSNLLAEGYLPFHSAAGTAGILYPAARVFRGGFNFTF